MADHSDGPDARLQGADAASRRSELLDQEVHYEVPGSHLADHWGLVLTYGIVLVGTGLLLALWPRQTLELTAVTLAFALVISGMSRMFLAMASASLHGSARGLVGLSGILGVVVGVLCLREPVQTLLLVGLLIGVWLLVAGFVDIISAALSPGSHRRVWDIAVGGLNVVLGAVLVVNPEISLGLLVVVSCVWLFAHGAVSIVSALRLRSRPSGTEPGPGGATATPR